MKSGPSCMGGDTGHLRSVSPCRGSEGLFSSVLASMQKHCEAKKMRLSISGPGCSSASSEEVRVNPPSSADVVTLFFSFTSILTLHLLRLGFVVNEEKSMLLPTRKIIFLGLFLDSVNFTVRLSSHSGEASCFSIWQNLCSSDWVFGCLD